jgi:hypothetical protein
MIGLKRIGIILSVLWIIGGGLWTRSMVIDAQGQFVKDRHVFCLEHDQNAKNCDAEFDARWQRDVTEGGINLLNAIFTFGPLLLAWGLFFIIARLTRWAATGTSLPGSPVG